MQQCKCMQCVAQAEANSATAVLPTLTPAVQSSCQKHLAEKAELLGLQRAVAQWRPHAVKCHGLGSTSGGQGLDLGSKLQEARQSPSTSSAARCYLAWHSPWGCWRSLLRGCSCCCPQWGLCAQGGSWPCCHRASRAGLSQGASRPGPS